MKTFLLPMPERKSVCYAVCFRYWDSMPGWSGVLFSIIARLLQVTCGIDRFRYETEFRYAASATSEGVCRMLNELSKEYEEKGITWIEVLSITELETTG